MSSSSALLASRSMRSHSSICSAITRPITTDEEFEEAWDSLNYIYDLPLKDLPPYESALQVLSKIDISKAPPGKGLYGLASGAGDVLKFMSNSTLVWVPQHKFDYMAERSLTERVSTAEQMRPHMAGLFHWLADYNWPPFTGCYKQLSRFPEATVSTIKEMCAGDPNDGELMEHVLDFVIEKVPKGSAWEELAPAVLSLQAKSAAKIKEGDDEWSELSKRATEWLQEYETWKKGSRG
ncbi:unnamed protein product [Clonostachys rosea f. rosea IK726]|uniref:DUF5071 domain-containing protein n=3 Tax=Bionectria ochroleuca TaxID=29856 RepID=A0A8H7NM77_BIOOC|nr:unnamed protein product [Clonostachys rosea f. rosea IK726]